MSITSRAYASDDDLLKIQAATAQWIATAGLTGYLHPADIALRLFNGMRRYQPQEILRLWEDEIGTLVGWAMVYPRWDSYEVQLHPAQRAGELEAEMLAWAESETWRWMREEGRTNLKIKLNIYEGDTTRIKLLLQRGYQRAEQHSTIGQRSLLEPIPDEPLPNGFNIRPMAGIHEIDKLVEVQNAAFGWHWTADEYRRIFNSPGYKIEQQMVAVSPDGRFAAFCYLLMNAHNRLAMFEDVGTHPDFRRMGLGKALLYKCMKRMIADGMDSVLVPYHITADAGKALYHSVGFRPLYNIVDYIKSAT